MNRPIALVPQGDVIKPRPGDNVSLFPGAVWEHECGSTRYILRRGGSIECAWCGKLLPQVWGDR